MSDLSLNRFYWSDGYRPHIRRVNGCWIVFYYEGWTRRVHDALKFAKRLNLKIAVVEKE